MRSDVKIGIICALVLVFGLIGWFAWSGGGKQEHTPGGGTALTSPGETGPRVPPPSNNPLGPRATYGDPPVAPPMSPLSSQPATVTGLREGSNWPTTVPATNPLGPGVPGMPGFDPGVVTPPTTHPFVTTLPTAGATEYSVKKGDSVWTIAKEFHVSRSALMAANNLTADSVLHEKQVLKIPASGTGMPATTTPATHPAATTTHPATGHAAAVTSYTVKAGDNLRKIAKSVYGDEAKWKQIYDANKAAIGSDANDITSGMVLKIP